MIYPTRTAVLAAGLGAPFALAVAAAVPQHWQVGLAWPLTVILAMLIDLALRARDGKAELQAPPSAYVGETRGLEVTIRFPPGRHPREVQLAIALDPLLDIPDEGRTCILLEAGSGQVSIPVTMARRGLVEIPFIWLRWTGSLGLVWTQKRIAVDRSFAILPDARPVHEHGARIFQRQALQGLLAQINKGEGTDFDTLVEFRAGMDRRAIDWKQTGRHMKLLAKEFRTERNNQIVFAVDSGRQMSEPVAGLPRVDRAVSAMLLTAWVALKLGDRVALHSFDSRPRVASGVISGPRAFAEMQRLAARIDYSGDETNYSFALLTLSARLSRRSMIVIFTEFADLTSADFMIRAARRLVETHVLLVVVLRDEELETIVDAEPEHVGDVTRVVTAAALLKDRRLVMNRLQHLGIHVIESEYDKVSERLVAGYVDLKRRNLL